MTAAARKGYRGMGMEGFIARWYEEDDGVGFKSVEVWRTEIGMEAWFEK